MREKELSKERSINAYPLAPASMSEFTRYPIPAIERVQEIDMVLPPSS